MRINWFHPIAIANLSDPKASLRIRCWRLESLERGIIFMTCPVPWSYHIATTRIVCHHTFDHA